MRWLLLLPVLVFLILFGVSNRHHVVELALWPFDVTWVTSVPVATMLFGAVAFLFGAFVTWTAALKYRHRARRLEEAARVLEAELVDLRGRVAREVGPVPPPSVGSPSSALVTLRRRAAA
jgi:lipopolysaccharide assembly protein A